MRPFLLPCVLTALALVAASRPPVRYDLRSESRFWIDGSSTAGSYTCTAARVDGTGLVDGTDRTQVSGQVTVPVRAFDCGQRRMNNDFAKALKSGTHPVIRFEVQSAQVAGPGASGWTRATATGSLEIGGVVRPITVDVDGQTLPDGRVRLRGRMPLRMTDFGVQPPTALLGLVRAHNRIVVRFDLIAAHE